MQIEVDGDAMKKALTYARLTVNPNGSWEGWVALDAIDRALEELNGDCGPVHWHSARETLRREAVECGLTTFM